MRRKDAFILHRILRFLFLLLGLFLALSLGTAAYAQSLNTDSKLPPSDTIGGRGSGILNVLLVGQDRREGEDHARSDSMILCTYKKETKTLTMTSFLRDLYVPIPGYSDNRINAAYAFGGIALLKETLEKNFHLHIDGSIEVDFSQFSSIIDLLGGIPLTLRQDEADYINQETGSSLTEGTQLLNGQQALVFSRIRSLDGDGDFSRTSRQRKVLNAMMDVCKTAGIPKMIKLIDQLTPMVSTDMSRGKLLGLALDLLPDLSDLEVISQHIPAPGTYRNATIRGMAVLKADIQEIEHMLQETILGEKVP